MMGLLTTTEVSTSTQARDQHPACPSFLDPLKTSIFTAAVAEFLMPSFKLFFKGATGNAPYDYQARLAGGDDGVRCESQLILISKGLGKTAARRH